MNATTTPKTVRELGDMAESRGMTATELLENLLRARFNPPAGFRMPHTAAELEEVRGGPDFGGFWNGPVFEGENWKVTSHCSVDQGVTFYIDSDSDEAIPASEALKIATALQAVADMAAG
jgi:hypothetical protein